MFVTVQTVRHREYFLPVRRRRARRTTPDDDHAGAAQQPDHAALSLALLLGALVAVVGLAKTVSPAIEDGVRSIGAPQAASASSSPCWCCSRRRSPRYGPPCTTTIQTSLNLALGSALASIGLTIPAIALASIWLSGPLVLGLGPNAHGAARADPGGQHPDHR